MAIDRQKETTLKIMSTQPADGSLIGFPLAARANGAASLRATLGCVMLSLVCFCFLFGNPAFAQHQASQKAAGGTLTIDPAAMQKPWTGDLEGMIGRRVIRVLTVNSKTFYFHDKGTQRGTVVDFFRLFEEELNKKLAAEKKLKQKHLKVRVVFIPLRRDQLLPGLAAGKGDIAAANLTITPERSAKGSRRTVWLANPGRSFTLSKSDWLASRRASAKCWSMLPPADSTNRSQQTSAPWKRP